MESDHVLPGPALCFLPVIRDREKERERERERGKKKRKKRRLMRKGSVYCMGSEEAQYKGQNSGRKKKERKKERKKEGDCR